jgi:hypothetical protein
VRRRTAAQDGRLRARIAERRALVYDEGACPTDGRSAHVRAASSLSWLGRELALVQDDANFLALLTRRALARAPSRSLANRASVRSTMDLDGEAGFTAGHGEFERLIALGSGSTPAAGAHNGFAHGRDQAINTEGPAFGRRPRVVERRGSVEEGLEARQRQVPGRVGRSDSGFRGPVSALKQAHPTIR